MFRKTLPLHIACKLLTLLVLGAASFCTLALELGPASVTSPLQAPLAATIPLHDSDSYSLDKLDVAISEEPAFAAAGLEWTPVIDNVHLELQEQQDVRQVIVRSSQPITAPWLDLLLIIDYPEGQLTHPVTLLFDPPDYARNTISQDAAVSTNVAAPSNSALASVNSNTVNGVKSVEVLEGDTLWRIAERSKPDHISVPQMMLALVKANPSIFPADDINSLRAGQTLNVPDVSQLDGPTQTDAAQAVQAMIAHGQHHTAQPASQYVEEASDQVETRLAPMAVPQSTQGTEQGSAITELAAQLNESQANLQQAQAEREQLRLELEELRESVGALRERMNEYQAALPDAIAPASAGLPVEPVHIDQHGEHSSELLTAGLERYQWPLISLALVLLLVGLIWLRKQREGEEQDHKQYWEGASLTEPVRFNPDAVTPHQQAFQSQSPNIPLFCKSKTNVRYSFTSQATPVGKHADHEMASGDADIQQPTESADFSRSQAAGLAEQRLEPLVSKNQPVNHDVPLTGYRLEVNDAVDSSGFVHASSTPSAPSIGGNTPNKTQQVQWQIEEVAFKPPGRDNS
ncbi:type IV pilus assembly protein FimV [Vreelandella populi]|uniref:type IV pilus assembly protein FimV n=1 Tax=Vreelandella populi TaxID=2498858 RepID=UPI00163B77B6|nr:FimV/HubP family polar landmark protein [Halomonas populi]